MSGELQTALLLYLTASDLGYEVAHVNAAWMLRRFPPERQGLLGRRGHGAGALVSLLSPAGSTREAKQQRQLEVLLELDRRAAESGNLQAAVFMGDAFYYGRGVDQDKAAAAEWYLGASRGEPESTASAAQACFNLALMYLFGDGVQQDAHRAQRQARALSPPSTF